MARERCLLLKRRFGKVPYFVTRGQLLHHTAARVFIQPGPSSNSCPLQPLQHTFTQCTRITRGASLLEPCINQGHTYRKLDIHSLNSSNCRRPTGEIDGIGYVPKFGRSIHANRAVQDANGPPSVFKGLSLHRPSMFLRSKQMR